MVTQERAQEIWQYRSNFGNFAVTPEEARYIREVWKSMPGHTCWADALLRIAKGGNGEDVSLDNVGDTLVVACYRFIEQPPEPLSKEEERELASLLEDGPVEEGVQRAGADEAAMRVSEILAQEAGTSRQPAPPGRC